MAVSIPFPLAILLVERGDLSLGGSLPTQDTSHYGFVVVGQWHPSHFMACCDGREHFVLGARDVRCSHGRTPP
ncbi:hypothetical protein A5788_04310 [Gordonia sp. 852002-50816_SCH5313054-c]|nr:hypothetical protein A5788_04310 [Gordonia sp. 852002-50816_SCH5313054-c]